MDHPVHFYVNVIHTEMTSYQLILSHDVQSCDEYLNRQANYSVFHRPSGKINADSALEFLWQIDEENCKNKDYEELNLKGDISWGAEKQFENEALMAVRTANFLSAFLQVLNWSHKLNQY